MFYEYLLCVTDEWSQLRRAAKAEADPVGDRGADAQHDCPTRSGGTRTRWNGPGMYAVCTNPCRTVNDLRVLSTAVCNIENPVASHLYEYLQSRSPYRKYQPLQYTY